MIRAIAAALALLIASAAYAGNLDVYQGIVLTAEVDHPNQVKQYVWLVFAPDRSMVPVKTEERGRRVRFMSNALKQQGEYLVWVIVIYQDANSEQLVNRFTIGPQPDPEPPDPEPGPNPPDPEPEPQPGIKWQIILFYESDDLDDLPLEQRAIILSTDVRRRIETDGHLLHGAFDDDAQDASGVPDSLRPWWAVIQGDAMPRVALAPRSGGEVKDYPLPADVPAFFQLLEGQP